MQVYEYTAPLWRRLLAFVIDLLIFDIFILSSWDSFIKKTFNAEGYGSMVNLLMANSKLMRMFQLIGFFMTILILGYFVVFIWMFKQTPGMMLFKLKIVSEKELRVWQILVRNLFLVPFFPFSLLWIIDPLYYFFSSTGQRWTEKLSKTHVVQMYVIGS